MLPTIDWTGETVVMIDQRKLPASEVYVTCRTAQDVATAIKTMVIRGAPAIGVAAAMGLALGMRRSKASGTKQFTTEFQKLCELMAGTRPTAVNLFWAIERMQQAFAEEAQRGASVTEITERLVREAHAIHDEDVQSCKTMGAHGATLVPENARILTHCNAGALATAGYGTALGVIRGAIEAGSSPALFSPKDECVLLPSLAERPPSERGSPGLAARTVPQAASPARARDRTPDRHEPWPRGIPSTARRLWF